MLEQELKPESRPRRTLRETERRRVWRSRLLGVAVVVALAAAAISAVKRALPQWIAMPGNTDVGPKSAQQAPFTAVKQGAFPSTTPMPKRWPNVRSSQPVTVRTVPKINAASHPAVVSEGLGPEVLPVEKAEVPRRHRRRHRSTQQTTTTPIPAINTPAKAAAPLTKSPESSPAELHSKPPDDVPDNP